MPPTFDLPVVGDANPDVIVGPLRTPLDFGRREQLVDHGVMTLGGSAAITACGADRLGLSVAFAGRVGDDDAGRYVRDRLAAHGVDTAALRLDSGLSTPLTVGITRGDGRHRRGRCPRVPAHRRPARARGLLLPHARTRPRPGPAVPHRADPGRHRLARHRRRPGRRVHQRPAARLPTRGSTDDRRQMRRPVDPRPRRHRHTLTWAEALSSAANTGVFSS
ncbi:carbohydrate kinase family protein [Streptomyces sp. NPDC001288]|uniref:carbohydrate kinase family protein n=1 Tax=Streptomyces sp. NPDC001297 TaxID=3364559 RepID=UPI00369F1E86